MTAVEAEARRYLRLFPAWMRADRGEEALGLVLDQVPDGAERLPVRSKVDLLQAGLHARRRGTPPPRVRSAITITPNSWVGDSGAVPVEWRPWLVTQLQRRTIEWQVAFLTNRLAWAMLVPIVLGALDSQSFDRWTAGFLVGLWIGHGSWWLVFRRHVWRERLQAANGLGPDDRPLPPGEVAVVWTRAVIDNLWVIPAAVAITAGAVAGTPLAWMVLHSGGPTRSLDGDAASAMGLIVAIAAVTAWWTVRQFARVHGPEPTPDTPPVASIDTPLVVSALAGACVGGAGAFAAVMGALFLGLNALALASAPLAGLVFLAIVVSGERRAGRRVGLWEVRPWLAPQRIARRVQDLPPPPATPDRPAFG